VIARGVGDVARSVYLLQCAERAWVGPIWRRFSVVTIVTTGETLSGRHERPISVYRIMVRLGEGSPHRFPLNEMSKREQS
jgi:hypothetical protein